MELPKAWTLGDQIDCGADIMCSAVELWWGASTCWKSRKLVGEGSSVGRARQQHLAAQLGLAPGDSCGTTNRRIYLARMRLMEQEAVTCVAILCLLLHPPVPQTVHMSTVCTARQCHLDVNDQVYHIPGYQESGARHPLDRRTATLEDDKTVIV
jgi:hypothetical protein